MTPTWIVHWSFDPIAFRLGWFTVHWYGLCWLLAFMQGEWLTRRLLARVGREDVDVGSLMIVTLLGTIIGARLAQCLFYDPAFYLAHPLKILAIWEGGMASHGGAVGFVVAIALGARRYAHGLPLLTLLDVVSLPSAIGGAIVRVANFLNSEIIGIPTSGSWGVVFDRVDQLPRVPAQLFEAAAYVLVAILLFWQRRNHDALMHPGRLTGWFLVLVFGSRAVLECWKVPQAAYEAEHVISVGQWLSLPFILIGFVLLWRSRNTTGPLQRSDSLRTN